MSLKLAGKYKQIFTPIDDIMNRPLKAQFQTGNRILLKFYEHKTTHESCDSV